MRWNNATIKLKLSYHPQCHEAWTRRNSFPHKERPRLDLATHWAKSSMGGLSPLFFESDRMREHGGYERSNIGRRQPHHHRPCERKHRPSHEANKCFGLACVCDFECASFICRRSVVLARIAVPDLRVMSEAEPKSISFNEPRDVARKSLLTHACRTAILFSSTHLLSGR